MRDPLPLSYCGPAPDPGALLSRWNGDPLLLGVLGLLGFLAVRSHDRASIAAVGAAIFLYVSPFCAWGASLFTVRVAHHLILALAVAPIAARALAPWLSRILGGLAPWTFLSAAAMWAWHAPNLYGWGATSDLGYWLMQATILGSATLFWHRVGRANGPAAIAALLAAMVAMGALGAIITLAPQALYAPHFATTAAWGMAPLDDQQLAGLLMWAPASALYLVAALVRVAGLVKREAVA